MPHRQDLNHAYGKFCMMDIREELRLMHCGTQKLQAARRMVHINQVPNFSYEHAANMSLVKAVTITYGYVIKPILK